MENTEQENKKSNKGMFIVVGIVVVLLLGWFFMRGAGGALTGVDLDRNLDGSSTYSKDGASVTVGGNKLPDNWPSDAPKYPGADIQYSGSSNPQTGEAGAMVMFLTKDNKQKVIDFYKNELSSNGWSIEQTMDLGGMTMVVANKDERTMAVQVAEDDNGEVSATISISIPDSN